MDRIYLDYASTTPVDKRVLEAMRPYFSEKFGNPSSLHSFGQEAMAALDKSRETLAGLIGANFNEVIFTSSATEANNLALRGAARKFSCGTGRLSAPAAESDLGSRQAGAYGDQAQLASETFRSRTSAPPRFIISSIEHESVLETARDLEREGAEVVYLPVGRNGIVALGQLEKALNENTVLVSIMYANNETGIVQPISKIAKIISDFRNSKLETLNSKQTQNPKSKNQNLDNTYPLLHVDAVQAFQYLDCDVDSLGVDLMTLSSHKIYGPKGVGALYARNANSKLEILNSKQIKNSKLEILKRKNSNLGFRISDLPVISALITGGGQEFELRSGTENIPAIVGFAKAAELVSNSRELENKKVGQLRNYLWERIKKSCPRARLNGSAKNRLPNNLNVYFPGIKAGELLMRLDLAGVAISAGSACASRALEPSHVLLAMGLSEERAEGSVRFTLGRGTTKAQIDQFIKVLQKTF